MAEPDPKRQEQDRAAFRRWHHDLESKSPQRSHIVALEVEARLRRLALSFSPLPEPVARLKPPATGRLAAHQRVERMATYVAGPTRNPYAWNRWRGRPISGATTSRKEQVPTNIRDC